MSATERRRLSGDDGLTIIELLVVLVLLSIVSVFLYSFLDNTTSISARVDDHNAAEREAIIAMRRMTQDVRSANPVLTTSAGIPECPTAYAGLAYGNCLQVILSRNTNLTGAVFCSMSGREVALPFRRVVFRLQGASVLEDRYEHTTSCSIPSSSSTDRPVLAELANPSGTRLFTFLDRQGAAIATGSSIANVASIRVNVVVNYRANSNPLNLTSVVALRNYRS